MSQLDPTTDGGPVVVNPVTEAGRMAPKNYDAVLLASFGGPEGQEDVIPFLRIVGGRIGTLDLSGARIDELLIDDVRIDYLNLGGARAVDLEISNCGIRTLDMPQADLTRVRFSESRSDEVDPRGLRAKDVDLRGLDTLAFLDANSLRGTTLSGFQVQQLAPLFAAGLGIQVKD